jgi:hypothetical protein
MAEDSDTNRRLAMLLTDNAVELMFKNYLQLPKRITGIKISREKLREATESFPKLVEAIEEHAKAKLVGIDLEAVEWFHQVRNKIYHDGHGVTPERRQVEAYVETAKLLFKNLYDERLELPETRSMENVGTFLMEWARVERALATVRVEPGAGRPFLVSIRRLVRDGHLENGFLVEFDLVGAQRNNIAHGNARPATRDVQRAKNLADTIEEAVAKWHGVA